jgi:hypothetical protein
MKPYCGLLPALIVAGLGLANDPSLAKQRGPIKIQPLWSTRILQADLPDLIISGFALGGSKCVGPSLFLTTFDIMIKNVGGATAFMPQGPWGGGPWVRARDPYPISIDALAAPTPGSLTSGQTATPSLGLPMSLDNDGRRRARFDAVSLQPNSSRDSPTARAV